MSHDSFKELLKRQYTWPTLFTFKFVVPSAKLDDLKALFPLVSPKLRPSSNGRFVSTTYMMIQNDPDQVLDTYAKASQVEKIIML